MCGIFACHQCVLFPSTLPGLPLRRSNFADRVQQAPRCAKVQAYSFAHGQGVRTPFSLLNWVELEADYLSLLQCPPPWTRLE